GGDTTIVVATAAGGGGFGYCSYGDEVVCGGVDDDDGVRMVAVVQSDGGRDDDGIRLMKMGVAVGCGGGGGRDGGEGVESVAQIRRIFLDGYGVLVVRAVIFKYLRLSSRMRAF
ncbi:hypothetical protein Tco_1036482, partial [Tanacetum coccineum]